jgi:endonuclease/exonuclease/phosphatase family metal-dependent hydrolase
MRTFETRRAGLRADRRLRSRLRIGAVVAAVATAGAALVATAMPAGASAPSAARIRVVAGNHQVTVGWTGVAGATGYAVRLSRSNGPAKTVHAPGHSVVFRNLPNGVRYSAQVTPGGVGGVQAAALRSPTASSTTSGAVPATIPVHAVKARSAGKHRIRVTWTGGGRATKVAVLAGTDVSLHDHRFSSGWRTATSRTVTLTVPKRYRALMGAGSGNPVFVKVVQSNSTAASPTMRLTYSASAKYRLTPPGTWAFAGAGASKAAAAKVTVAEYNVQSVGASKRYSKANRWAARLPRVAATVKKAHPDVLLTAELATSLLTTCHNHPHRAHPTWCTNHTQYASLRNKLAGGTGVRYKLATNDAYKAVIRSMYAHPSWNRHITAGAHIFYNPKKLTLLKHGYISPAFTLGLRKHGWTPSVTDDRWVSWARLKVKATGSVFTAVAAHFPVGTSARMVRLRALEASALIAKLKTIAGTKPVVFGGDLNADAVRTSNAAATTFVRHGYFDAASTVHRVNMRYSTAKSGRQDGADPGYPVHPTRRPYPTSRIDYLMVKGSKHTYRYTNVLNLLPDGRFNPRLLGSDHNLQLATIGLPR